MVIMVSSYISSIKEDLPRNSQVYQQLMDTFVSRNLDPIIEENNKSEMVLADVLRHKKSLDEAFSATTQDFNDDLKAYLACIQFLAGKFFDQAYEIDSIQNYEAVLLSFKRQLIFLNKQFGLDNLVDINSLEAKALQIALNYCSGILHAALDHF